MGNFHATGLVSMFRILAVTLFMMVSLLPTSATAAVLTVGTGPDCQHSSIQAALDAASSGDEIQLRSETFEELVNISKSLSLAGGYSECGDSQPHATELSTILAPPGSDAPIISIANSRQVELSGLLVTGANHAGNGGGILIGSSANVSVERVDLTGNVAALGGGVYVNQSAVLRTAGGSGIRILDNEAGLGGGIYLRNLASLDFASEPATQVLISGNQADFNGGGVYHAGRGSVQLANSLFQTNSAETFGGALSSGPATGSGSITLTNCVFQGNTAMSGGAINVAGNSGIDASKTLAVSGGVFNDNTAADSGGALSMTGAVSATLHDTELAGNTAIATGGGAILVRNGELLLASTTLANNVTQGDGGALRVEYGQWRAEGHDEENNFSANSAAGTGGAVRQIGGTGAISDSPDSLNTVRFIDNLAGSGGAIHVSGGDALLRLSTPLALLRNHAQTGNGGALFANEGARIESDGHGSADTRIIFNGNGAWQGGGAIHLDNAELEAAWLQIGGLPLGNLGELANMANFQSGGGLNAINGSDVRLYNSVVEHNGSGSVGGGLALTESSLYFGAVIAGASGPEPEPAIVVTPCLPMDLDYNQYCAQIDLNSTAFEGGGVVIQASTAMIEQTVVRENTSINNVGSALAAIGGSTLGLGNVLISGHDASAIAATGGSDVEIVHATITDNGPDTLDLDDQIKTSLSIFNSIVWANDGVFDSPPQASVTSGCNITQSAGLDGLFADPLLSPSPRGDYRLGHESPAMDLCAESPTVIDLDGAHRPQAIQFDAGAFEGPAIPDQIFSDGFLQGN
jgi:fibronectin-binding autotransporter adhesin